MGLNVTNIKHGYAAVHGNGGLDAMNRTLSMAVQQWMRCETECYKP